MTWSGATADLKRSPDEFSPAAKTDKKVVAQAAPAEAGSAEPVQVDIPADPSGAGMPLEDSALEAPAPEAQTYFSPPYPVPLPPVFRPVVQRSDREICDSLTAAAQANNLPVHYFINLLFQESGFNPAEVSTAGALGIAQFMPETAADMGVDNPFDPLQAIPASARLLRNLVAQFGNLGLAAAAYNAGPKRIQDWLGKKGKLPEETQGYVKTITGRPAETWTAAAAEYPGQRLPRHAPCQEAAGLYAWSGPETIPLPAPSPMRIARLEAHHETRVAANDIAKPATSSASQGIKLVSQQLAARKHGLEKHKLDKVAQR